tara:strand:- start:231 stop:989 length:759 start_codon:yes stop_codon:yes gene_type:complete
MINVNTVYQTVLFILNKEQRGYMTPAEFNSLATQVQLEIFDKYFEDLNVFLRQPTNDSEYANRIKTVEEKISIFEEQKTLQTPYDLTSLDPTFYKLGSVTYERSTLNPYGPEYPTVLEEITQGEFNLINKSPLTRPSSTFPVFTLRNNQLKISPSIVEIIVNYIRKPKDVRWGYTTGSLGQYLYDNTVYNPSTYPSPTDPLTAGSTQFELSDIDQTEVIIKILQYAGIIIRDPQIVQTASVLSQQEEVAEKS